MIWIGAGVVGLAAEACLLGVYQTVSYRSVVIKP